MSLFSYRKTFRIIIAFCSLFFLSVQISYADLDQFKANTNALLRLLSPQSTVKSRSQAPELQSLINERKKLLSDNTQVGNYYNYLLPQNVTSRLPQTLQSSIETEVTDITGVLEIRAELNLNKTNQEAIHYLLRSDDNKIYYITWAKKPTTMFKTGDTIKIEKAFIITENNGSSKVLVHPDNVKLIKQAVATAVPDSFGPQTTIVMLVNFNDDPNNHPWTSDEVKAVMKAVNDMYYEASYKQTTVVSTLVGWYVLNLNSHTDCDTIVDQVAKLADNAARAAGVDLSKYKRKVYMFPEVASCGWAGLGTIGGSPSLAWLNGYNNAHVTGHELGHNIALFHSHSLECPGSPNQGNCSRNEYGDVVDTMGIGWLAPHFNAFQKDYLGWLNYQSSPPIQTVTTNGSYVIDPFETVSTKPKALKVLKKSNSNGSSDYYYLEYRQPIGFDADLNCAGCDYTKGVIIHQANNKDADSSEMLDMSPNTDNKLVALLPGQTFKDANAPSGGVTFTVSSVSSGGAAVNIAFGSTPPPPSCVRANPTLTINPSTTQWITAGGKANWVVTIKNNDSSQCPKSAIKLSTKKPPLCMQPRLSKPFVTLAPGASTTVDLVIATASWLPADVYSIYVIGTNTSATSYTGQVTALLGLSATSSLKPSTTCDS